MEREEGTGDTMEREEETGDTMEREEGTGESVDQIEEDRSGGEEDSEDESGEEESGSEEDDESEGTEQEGSEEEESGEEDEDLGDEEVSDWETSSDTSEEEEEEGDGVEAGEEDAKVKGSGGELQTLKSSGSSTHPELDDVSDLSDNETERCPVCLSRFDGQDVGSPESCDHTFCLECILVWSKNVNTCPVDRQVFRLILARHELEGPVFKKVRVEDTHLQVDAPPEEDLTCCEVCGQSNREDRLLLCDGCDLAYHCECLTPALRRVPVGEWFCPGCSAVGVPEVVPEEVAMEEEDDEEEEMPQRTRLPRAINARSAYRRQIARTLVAERVRSEIAELRSVRGRRRIVSDSESDGSLVIEDDTATAQPSTSASRTTAPRAKRTVRRRRKTRKRKTKRKTTKRKTTRRKTTTTATGKTKTKRKTTKRKTRRRRKGKKKRKVRTLRTTPTTVKTRLAEVLGMKKPPVGRSIPVIRQARDVSMDSQRQDIGLASLSILGNRDDLDPFSEVSDEEIMSTSTSRGSTAVAHRSSHVSHFSRASLKSHAVIRRPAPVVSREASSQAESQSTPFDILGDIMMGQSLLHMKSDNITIHRDGSLQPGPQTKTSGQLKAKDLKGGSARNSSLGDDGGTSPANSPTSGGSSESNNQSGGSLDGGSNSSGSFDHQGDGSSNSGPQGAGGLSDGHQGTGSLYMEEANSDMDTGPAAAREQPQDSQGKESGKDKDGDHSDSDGDSTKNIPADQTGSPGQHGSLYSLENNDDDDSNSGSPKYDPSSPSDFQIVDEVEEERNSEKNETDNENQNGEPETNGPKEEEEENDQNEDREEYDPFAPTSDNEGGAAGMRTPTEAEQEESKVCSDVEHEPQEEQVCSDVEHEPQEEQVCSDVEHEPQEERDRDGDDNYVDGQERTEEVGDEETAVEEREQASEQGSELEDEGLMEDEEREDLDSDDDDVKIIPISELPRIPKIKRKETIEIEDELPTRSVLERANLQEKQDSFPRWEKRDRERAYRDRSERDRGDRDDKPSRRREKDAEKEYKRTIDEEDSDSSRHRHRHKRRDRDRERNYEHEKSDKYADSENDEPPPSRHKHKKRSRSRSKERRRERSRRSRSRSHEKSRRRGHEHSSRDRSPSRDRPNESEKSHRKHSKDYDRKHSRRRSRSRSPHYRERDYRDKDDRDVSGERSRDRRSIAEDLKGSAKMFSQSLKEASDMENTGRRFKLKRNFYQGSENVDPGKRYRYDDSEGSSSHDRRSERPEVKSAVVKPVAVQELYDSDDSSCEIIKVEIKGVTVSKDEPLKRTDRSKHAEPVVSSAPATSTSSKASEPIPLPQIKLPPKTETKVTFKLPDKNKSSTTLIAKNRNVIFGSDDDEDSTYDPFEPTEPSSPPAQLDRSPVESVSSPESSEDTPPLPEPEKEEKEEDEAVEDEKEEILPPPPAEEPEEEPESPPRPPIPPAVPIEIAPRPPLIRMAAPPEGPPPPHGQRIQGPGNMVLHHMGPLGMLQPPPPSGRPVLMNPMIVNGPPPPFGHMPQFPPGRMWTPNVMLRGRLPPSLAQNGGPTEHIRLDQPPPPMPHIRPGMPPPPPPPMSETVDLTSLPPPLPPKALKEMEQISQLLNAQANKLAQLHKHGAPPPPPGPAPRKDTALFKVPMPPPPLPPPNKDNARSGSDLDMEVVDMDVASPLSDDDTLMSFSPPPLEDERPTSNRDGRNFNANDNARFVSDVGRDDDVPTSAVELDKRQKVGDERDSWKFIKKLNRQERVVEEVKLAIKPHYSKGKIDKEEYKEIMRKAVPKICHSKSGEINSAKIRTLVAAYVEKVRKMRKYMAKKSGDNRANGRKMRK